MDIHQGISISPKSKDILKEGNIVSAEPGIYVPGVGGIRIEDTCLITKNGCERLTDFDRRITFV
jgi:Xaa-Pro dipeptidase